MKLFSVEFEQYSKTIADYFLSVGPRFVVTLIVFLVLNVLMKYGIKSIEHIIMQRLMQRVTEDAKDEMTKRIQTLIRISRRLLYSLLWIVALMMILSQLGINIGPILATAGVLSLAVSFGAQSLIKDFISGMFLIIENQIRIGDVAIINGTGGLVEAINLRTVVLRDLSGVVHIFANGSINTISNMTLGWSAFVFDIAVAYKEDVDQVEQVMADVMAEMQQNEKFGPNILAPLEIFGVDDFADSAVIIKARVKTKPIKQWDIAREYRGRLKKAFDAQDIEIPFPHRSIHFGEASKAFKVLMEQVQK